MRRATSLLASVFIVIGVLSPSPAAAAPAVRPPELAPAGESPSAPPAADRRPVRAPTIEDGLRNPRQADLRPQKGGAPQDAFPGARLRPQRGGPSIDAYGRTPDDAHFAIVHPGEVNVRDADGNWVPQEYALAPTEEGWSGQVEEAEVSFPQTLGGQAGGWTSFTSDGVRIESSPIEASASEGQLVGDTLIYPGAFPATDLRYRLTPFGYKEEAVLKGPRAPTALSWEVRSPGLELALTEGGEIALMVAGETIGMIPNPVAFDAEYVEADLDLSLSDLGGGRWRLDLALPEEFLADATYPILLDPSTATRVPQRDGFVTNSSPDSSFEGSTYLKVGSGKRSFLRFDTTQLQKEGRLVYGADVAAWIVSQDVRSESVNARKVTTSWPGSLTWNTQPSAGDQVFGSGNAATNDWMYLDLAELYQRHLDGTWHDKGFRLTSTDAKTFYSDEAGGTARPQLLVSYNDLPAAVGLELPSDGSVAETLSPALKLAKHPNQIADANGDDVLVQFQVSDDPSDFTGSHLVYSSPWADTIWHTVPSGVLTDGQTYYWRARTWDICQAPDGMCPLTDGAGNERTQPVSGVRSFTVSVPHHGEDPRYAMWSQGLGNDMTLKVNRSSGNAYLDLPLDALATPVDDLALGLTYNHQLAADSGLGAGWQVSAGPASSRLDLPQRLKEKDTGIKMWFRDGSVRFFSKRNHRTYGGFGAGSGVVKRNKDDSFRFETTDGSTFTFGPGGVLWTARPAGTADAYQGVAFDYDMDAAEHLTKVTDVLGRAVTFSWTGTESSSRLSSIMAWDGRTWTLGYSGNKVSSITHPGGERVELSYDASGRLAEIRDGQQVSDAAAGWTIAYAAATGDSSGLERVAQVAPPGAAASWAFSYEGPFTGTTAATSRLIDPRGPGTSDPNDYTTIIEFNWAGLPIRNAGPVDQHGHWPLTTQVWDSNNNLLCTRSPAANAVSEHCTALGGTDDPLSTVYGYQDEAPHRLVSVTHPAPNPDGTGERATETYGYDEPTDFRGLWLERFDNNQLSGEPVLEGQWTDMDQGWGTGSPPGIGPVDHWSLRWSGYLVVTEHAHHKFRVWSDDGVALSVGGDTLFDCFGQAISSSSYNCETDRDRGTWLAPGLRPITIEFQERTDMANFKMEWDQGTGNWKIPGAGVLRMGRGLLTSKTGPKLETTYTYPGDEAKARLLAATETTTDLATSEARTTATTYDQFGRPTHVTAASGTPIASTVVTSYLGTCPASVTDPSGAVVETVCDPTGLPTQVTQHVRAVGPQPAHDRVTVKDYDAAGRQTLEDPPGPARTVTTYDDAGRTETVTTTVSESGTPADPTDDVVATTTYEYDAQGGLWKEHLPDPDGAGPAAGATVTHTYDEVGNEIEMTDERGNTWLTAYDAQGRVIGTTSPSGLSTATVYTLVDGTGTHVNEVQATTSEGVTTVTTADLLGRPTTEKVGTLDATTFDYDVAGNVIRTTDPAGVWTEQDYTAFGDVTSERTLSPAPGNPVAETTRSYDALGRVVWADGPRAGTGDRVSFGYDAAGRLDSATQEGVPAPNTTTVLYTDAGERVRVDTPGDTTITREWIYDQTGQAATFRDIRDATITYETHTSYNGLGLPVAVDDPRGHTLRFAYDHLGRETRRWSDLQGVESAAISSTFDAAGNLVAAEVEVSGLQTSFVYDADGRTDSISQGGATTTYAYEPATGQLSSVTDPAGTTAYAYGPNGLLSSITDPLSGSATTYGYDGAGRAVSRTDPAGLTWSRTYDASGVVSSQEALAGTTEVFSLAMTYDVAGAPTTKDVFVQGAPASENGTWAYAYDPAGRMTSATDPGGETTTYGYDGAGNRMSVKVGPAAAVTTTYDSAGLPVSASDGTTYTHDQAGNLTGIDGPSEDWTYAYDPWGNLSRAVGGDPASPTQIDYTYDALSRVATRTEGGTQTAYTYRSDSEDPAAITEGTETTLFAYSPSGPLAQQTAAGVSFFLRDLHGDVVGTASAGAATGSVSYSAWGEPRASSGESSSLGYQGDLTDSSTGLVDMGTRLYAPSLGRFTTRDVLFGDLAFPVTLNQYVYGAAAPVQYTDPTGMCPEAAYGYSCSGYGSTTSPEKTRASGKVPYQPSRTGGYTGGFSASSYSGGGTTAATGLINYRPPRPSAKPKLPNVGTVITDVLKAAWGGVKKAGKTISDGMQAGLGTLKRVMEVHNYVMGEVRRQSWQHFRARRNAALTRLGVGYAKAWGGKCGSAEGLMVVCTGVAGAGPREGITIGNAYMTKGSFVGPDTLRHETKHADQWAIFGDAFPALYGMAEVHSYRTTGKGACGNIFEIWAGLEDGGYHSC